MSKVAITISVLLIIIMTTVQLSCLCVFAQTEIYMGDLKEGDANADHVVNGLDFNQMVGSFLIEEGQPGFDPNTDFTKDGIVNGFDFNLIVGSFLEESPVEI